MEARHRARSNWLGNLEFAWCMHRIGLPNPHVCRKPVNAHKANTEMNKLASHESLRLDCVGESDGIFATHLAEDNTDSLLRIESLYDSSHSGPLC